MDRDLINKIKRDALDTYPVGLCDVYFDKRVGYVTGALSVAEQLVKAVEVIKYYADQGFENAIPEDAQEFLEEHERWMNEL